MSPRHRFTTDPWTAAGLALLALLTVGTAALYRVAPQSVAQVRTRAWVAARPNAYEPRMSRARDRLQAAAEATSDSAAASAFASAAENAWRARGVAEGEAEAEAATALWAQALLGWAERLREAGTGTGLRPDDEETLRQALSLVERVRSVPTPPAVTREAESLHDRIRRQLRVGPLEWLPLRR